MGQQVTYWPANVIPHKGNAEVGRITAISTDPLAITRTEEDTTNRDVQAGWQIATPPSPKAFTDIENAINQKTVVTVGASSAANQEPRVWATMDS